MTKATIFCDAIEHAGPSFRSNRHRQRLAKGFGPEACFYLEDSIPYVVYPDWDYAEYWGHGPIHEVHPFGPVLRGNEISELEFRARIREIHGI